MMWAFVIFVGLGLVVFALSFCIFIFCLPKILDVQHPFKKEDKK